MTSSLLSTLTVKLIDGVTAPAKKAAASLRTLNSAGNTGGPGFTERLAVAQGRLGGAIERNNAALADSRGKLFDAVAGFYALKGAILAPVSAAADFESAMADVRKVVDFPTPQAFEDFQAALVDLSKTVPLSVNGLAEIAAAAGQAGIAGEDLIPFTEAAAKIGVAFDISADQAGDALAKLRTGLGISTEEAVLLSDAMNHLSNAQASSAEEILDVVRRVGAQAKLYGFTAEQTAAFASAMISAGAESEVAATSFRNMGMALTRGASATKRQKDALKELGLSSTQVAKDMQEDAVGTVIDVLERISKLPKEVQGAVSSDLFGNEARALGPLLTNLDLVKESIGLVADEADYAGSSFKEFEVRAATFQNATATFNNRITALKIAIGNALIPALNDLMATVSPMIEAVTDFAAAHPELTKNVLAAAAALVSLRIATSALSFVGLIGKGGALSLLAGGLKLVQWAGTPVAGFFETLAMRSSLATAELGKSPGIFARLGDALTVLGAGPLGILKNVITWAGRLSIPLMLAGAAIKFVMDNLEGIQAMFGGATDSFLKGLDFEGINKLGEAFKPLEPILKPVADAMGVIWGFIAGDSFDVGASTEEWRSWGEVIGGGVAEGVNKVVGGINALIDGVKTALGWVQSLGQGISDLWNSAGNFLTGKPNEPEQKNWGTLTGPGGGPLPPVDGARASGGPVWKGGSFLVGENEPEIFTPRDSGTITPLSRMGSGPISIGPFHFNGISGDPAELQRVVQRATEDAINSLLRGAHADAGARA